MSVAGSRLLRDVVALWLDQMQFETGPCHCDVQEPPLLVDARGRAGRKLVWECPVVDVQHVDRIPFLSFRGMNGGKHEVVLVPERRA